jgi:hypothetical protein
MRTDDAPIPTAWQKTICLGSPAKTMELSEGRMYLLFTFNRLLKKSGFCGNVETLAI